MDGGQIVALVGFLVLLAMLAVCTIGLTIVSVIRIRSSERIELARTEVLAKRAADMPVEQAIEILAEMH